MNLKEIIRILSCTHRRVHIARLYLGTYELKGSISQVPRSEIEPYHFNWSTYTDRYRRSGIKDEGSESKGQKANMGSHVFKVID